MKQIKYKFYTLIVLISLISCTDNNDNLSEDLNDSSIATFEDYFNFLNTETDGTIIVQSVRTPLSNEAFMVSSSIEGNRQPLALNVDDEVITFTDYNYSESSDKSTSNITLNDLSSIYGNIFQVELANNEMKATRIENSSGNSVESVYIPQLISANFTGLENGKIVAGSQITWNFDNQNENGVVVGFEYNPLTQVDESVVNQKPDRQLSGITLSDSGTYTITAEDIADFPTYSMITFYIGRAGYNITNDNSGNDYSLAGLTVSRADIQISK